MSNLDENGNEIIEEEVIEVEEPLDDLTSELAAAWDNSEAEEAEETPEAAPVEAESAEAAPVEATDAPVEAEDVDIDTAPIGMSIEAREHWKDTPDAVKKFVANFEKRNSDMAAKYGADTQRVLQMDKVLEPYQQLFAMNGGAGNVLPSVMETASILQLGNPQQKAQRLAEMMSQFDVDVRLLDELLVGAAPSAAQQQQTMLQQQIQQEVAPLQQQVQFYEQQQQQQQQAERQRMSGEIQDFGATHEFYYDVVDQMADLIDMSHNRKINMGMEEAYKVACLANEQISKVIESRRSQELVQSKRNAASSVYGNSGGSMSGNAPSSVEAALNEAWDNQGRM